MDYEKLYGNIFAAAKKEDFELAVCSDLSDCLINWHKENPNDKTPYRKASEVLNAQSFAMHKCVEKKDFHTAENFRKLIYRTLLFSSRENFDHYMQALEYEREYSTKFYLPRRRVLLKTVKALQAIADGQLDELFISMPPRTGKALADDTPILTREGWKNHGDLKVGDEVIGLNGEFKKVLYVHPKCQLDVMMEFSNGEKIQCHENHEWMFHDRGRTDLDYVLHETKYYEKRSLSQGTPGKRGHRYIFQLPKHGYVQGEEKELPIDPYTFGVWLGDGSNTQPRITNDKRDYAIIEKIISKGYKLKSTYLNRFTGVYGYDFDFRQKLHAYGLCYDGHRVEKYIPDDFLTASVEQRLELLAGLLDTDGTYVKKENRYHYCTCEEKLKDTFVELISTFGWRASVTTAEPKVSTSGIVGKKVTYVVGFNPDCEIPCVLERKRNHTFSKYRAIGLKSITRVAPKQGNCITVEGDGMYLAGRTMVPTHNTGLTTFYYTWQFGRTKGEPSNLYVSYSDMITGAFYNGVLEVLQDPHTYKWGEIFSDCKIVSTNAKDETLDINRDKKYHTLTCRSLYGTLNGSCDCSEGGTLIADDLLSGIEEAMNPDRLDSAWAKVDNNMLTRGPRAKVIWVGTRWSLQDPIGRRLSLLETDFRFYNRRYTVINTPALNEKDESNFNYDSDNIRLTTEYFRQRRASFERNNAMCDWFAQYQGEPIERGNTLFEVDGFRYFNGDLPDGEPDRKFMAVDPAFGGGDFTAAPIIYQYGDDCYVVDVVYNDGEKNITQPLIASKIVKHMLTATQIEANKAFQGYVDGVQKEVNKLDYKLKIVPQRAPNNASKEQRILDMAPNIREHFVFLNTDHRSKEYNLFMQNVFSFKVSGKNKHDDAPDALAQAAFMAITANMVFVQAVLRPC